MATKDDFRAACEKADLESARALFAGGQLTSADVDEVVQMFRNMPRRAVMEWLLTLSPSTKALEQLMYRDVHRADGSR